MAKQYQHKRSSEAGKIPTTNDLLVGEIAVNFEDKKLYTKDETGNVFSVGGSGGSGGGGGDGDASGLIAEHNQSSTAHPELRELFTDQAAIATEQAAAARSSATTASLKESSAALSSQSAQSSATQASARNLALNADGGHALNDIAAMYAIDQTKLSIYPSSGGLTVGNFYLYKRGGIAEVWKANSTAFVSDPQDGSLELLPVPNRGGVLLTGSFSGAARYDIDVSAASLQKVELTATSTTIAFTNQPSVAGKTVEITLFLKQGIGSNLVVWQNGIKWQNGRKPLLSYNQGSEDIIILTWVDGDPQPYGFFVAGWIS